jgi:hypothetical protein
MDLVVAAMISDTAIRHVQKAEAEFHLVVKRPKKYPANTHPVWTLLDVLDKPDQESTTTTNIDTQESDNTFWFTYKGLKY